MPIEHKVDAKCVNSKILFGEISKFVNDGFDQIGSLFARDSGRMQFVSVVNDFFYALQDNDIITHWNVICDQRNNKVADMEAGQFRLTVSYKQRNCLNTTELRYLIRVNLSEDWMIDFSI